MLNYSKYTDGEELAYRSQPLIQKIQYGISQALPRRSFLQRQILPTAGFKLMKLQLRKLLISTP